MKYCDTCGEVYASHEEVCPSDGGTLSEWRQPGFQREESQVTNVRDVGPDTAVHVGPNSEEVSDVGETPVYEDSQITEVQSLSEQDHTEVRAPEDDSEELRTRIHIPGPRMPAPRVGQRAARGKHADAGADVGEHTDVIEPRAQQTLTDFSASSEHSQVGGLVVYDDEVGGPFEGMLVANRYRLETQIGTGAFGVVFNATDRDTGEQVAIKLLSPALCDDKRALARFRREAIAASRIQHPGIVGIHDFGIQDAGVSYIVMEYLDGRDLANVLEDERFLLPERAANIVQQCAQALASAHDEGVLHRDLKPANIFLVQSGNQSERIKILDFGIAKDRTTNPRNADLTSASKVVGTPYYMAPEQAKGETLDARADIYSLGVILYQLITGKRPFEGASVYDILLAHVSGDRVPPSSVRPELASEKELENIVLKAISAKASHRYDTMKDFSMALRGYLRTAAARRMSDGPHLSWHGAAATVTDAGTGYQRKTPSPAVAHSRWRLAWAAVPAAVAVALFAFFSGGADATSKPTEPAEALASPPEAPADSAALEEPGKAAGADVDTVVDTDEPAPKASKATEPNASAPADPVADDSKPKRRRKSRSRKARKKRPKGIAEW